jgi:hypothetical protein
VPHGGAFKIIIVETSTAMTNRGRVYNSGHSMSRKNTLQRDYATVKEGVRTTPRHTYSQNTRKKPEPAKVKVSKPQK